MGKNSKWTIQDKRKIVNELLGGSSYRMLAKKYNVKSVGMIANWKKKYINGQLVENKRGRTKYDKDVEYEILKKSFALLKAIRDEQQE